MSCIEKAHNLGDDGNYKMKTCIMLKNAVEPVSCS